MNKLLISLTASLALLAAGPVLAQENQQSPEATNPNGGYSDPASAGTQKTNRAVRWNLKKMREKNGRMSD